MPELFVCSLLILFMSSGIFFLLHGLGWIIYSQSHEKEDLFPVSGKETLIAIFMLTFVYVVLPIYLSTAMVLGNIHWMKRPDLNRRFVTNKSSGE